MKKSILLSVFFTAIFTSFYSCAQEQRISNDNLKDVSKAYLQEHFPNIEIASVILEDDKDYDVTLADGTDVEFYKDGSIEKVERKGAAIPTTVVPAKIAKYVSQNYPQLFIQEMKVERSVYEIELNNDLDLIFSKNGEFKKLEK